MEWPSWLARALIVLGVSVYGITESLGLFSRIDRWTLAATWLVTGLVCFWVAPRPRWLSWNGNWFVWGCAAIVGTLAGLIGFTGLVSPPNSADAMAYHLSRVVYWSQAGNVSFFETPYFNQVSLPPLGEYFMLHGYVLSGGDYLVNSVQWLGYLGSLLGVFLVAGSLGASPQGRAFAVLFAATIPVVVLQASGAKTELALSMWLLFAVYFLSERSWVWFGLAVGLAVATKSTAYLFLPPLLCAVTLMRKLPALRVAGAAAAGVLLLNAPLYVRNYRLSGSVLGYDSAQGDGAFRWRNERFGWKVTASNAIRHGSEQLGARSEGWNQGVFRLAMAAHSHLGIDANDPATTWRWERFTPPKHANHEANAPGRMQLAFLAATAALALWRKRWSWLVYGGGIVGGYLLYSSYLKWQPFMSRLESPLLLLAAPLTGPLVEGVRWRVARLVLCYVLIDGARLPLLENWTRPLRGEKSLFAQSREQNYFRDFSQLGNADDYFRAVEIVAATGCQRVGLDIRRNQLEYPLQALLRRRVPGVQFVHAPSAGVCAVVCLDCAGQEEALRNYSGRRVHVVGRIAVLI